jgi:hypothetical protein
MDFRGCGFFLFGCAIGFLLYWRVSAYLLPDNPFLRLAIVAPIGIAGLILLTRNVHKD